jgi:stage II sporulation protein D
VIERGCGGVVAALMVEGSKETCIVRGENAVRSLMGNNKCAIITQSREIYNDILPSAFCIFKPVYDNGTLVSYEITGGGYGHGIGMSQNAVKKMSETMDYTDILKFFYNNIEIKNIND